MLYDQSRGERGRGRKIREGEGIRGTVGREVVESNFLTAIVAYIPVCVLICSNFLLASLANRKRAYCRIWTKR